MALKRPEEIVTNKSRRKKDDPQGNFRLCPPESRSCSKQVSGTPPNKQGSGRFEREDQCRCYLFNTQIWRDLDDGEQDGQFKTYFGPGWNGSFALIGYCGSSQADHDRYCVFLTNFEMFLSCSIPNKFSFYLQPHRKPPSSLFFTKLKIPVILGSINFQPHHDNI